MATPNASTEPKAPSKSTNTAKVENEKIVGDESDMWDDFGRLPMYNVTECSGPVFGHAVDAKILPAAGGTDQEGNKAFAVFVVLTTRECMAKLNEEIVRVSAGKEIYVHGAALNDLIDEALHPTQVFQFRIEPVIDAVSGKVKMQTLKSSGNKMPLWNVKRKQTPSVRKEVTSRIPTMSAQQFRTALGIAKKIGLGAGDGDATSFDTKQIEE